LALSRGSRHRSGSPAELSGRASDVLTRKGEAGPTAIEFGYHLCYGSPADEHCVQPKDMAIMVEIANATSAGVARPIQFFHMPVPKGRTDDAYFGPLDNLRLHPGMTPSRCNRSNSFHDAIAISA
jgi:hypothetical protein